MPTPGRNAGSRSGCRNPVTVPSGSHRQGDLPSLRRLRPVTRRCHEACAVLADKPAQSVNCTTWRQATSECLAGAAGTFPYPVFANSILHHVPDIRFHRIWRRNIPDGETFIVRYADGADSPAISMEYAGASTGCRSGFRSCGALENVQGAHRDPRVLMRIRHRNRSRLRPVLFDRITGRP